MMGGEKCGEGKQVLMTESIPHRLSTRVEALLMQGHVMAANGPG